MRFIDRVGPGQLSLNHMWLPTWIGMNTALLQEIDAHLTKYVVGKELTEETLDKAHELVVNFLAERFPDLHGLLDYLDGVKYVEIHGNQAKTQTQGG